jgi:hypothetical protein
LDGHSLASCLVSYILAFLDDGIQPALILSLARLAGVLELIRISLCTLKSLCDGCTRCIQTRFEASKSNEIRTAPSVLRRCRFDAFV